MENFDKVDIFWHQRLLRKHKSIEEFRKNLLICLGYYHEKACDDIISELEEKKIL
jgi:hypothetical protein